ncbi:MAG: hypothetical protein N2050_00030 [Flavobacteriales bacterium]|nr:hypothetical protein [Flavobacteriales bacterium]
MKRLIFCIAFILLGAFQLGIKAQSSSTPQVTQVAPPKELMQDADPFQVHWYDTDEKVLHLEARIKEIRKNLAANKDNPLYDRTTMNTTLSRLEAVYQELKKSGRYKFLDKE